MMVMRYELECGSTVEIMVASDQVREDQSPGTSQRGVLFATSITR